MKHRRLSYINSKNEMVDFNPESIEVFLFELTGVGFSYFNDISDTNYQNVRRLKSSRNETNEITGSLEIINYTNKSIYLDEKRISTILNYDQLVARENTNVYGKLVYENETGNKLWIPCLIKNFIFGETNDEDGYLKLPIELSFDRLTRIWYSYIPLEYVFELEGGTGHGHSFRHPYSHMVPAGFGNVGIVSGNDLAKFYLEIYGPFSPFSLTFVNEQAKEEKKIVYADNVEEGEVLIIDNFKLSITKNNKVAMEGIDLVEGNSPFFDLKPNTQYSFIFDADILNGKVKMQIFEGWVSVW